ncbi:gp53-like domain-containing protein [Aliivibrio salmonicida]|uniref:gp53-like domain-containing protein n=1 Tax=Aliivibrio salmonicida TaxID=40269 RepID=UPI00406CAB72
MSLLITDAGIAASIQASDLGVSYKITHIGMGTSGYVPSHNQTSLRDETARRPITQGSVPGLGQLHFEVLFDGDIEYEAREIGYFLEDGTLFAVDSRNGDIISIKRADTVITEVFDLTLSGSEINTITVEIIGAANATERIAGIARIITNEQVGAGIDDSAFLTIKKLLQRTASTLRSGVVQLSNCYNGTSEEKAVTEKALSDGLVENANESEHSLTEVTRILNDKFTSNFAFSFGPNGYIRLPNFLGGLIIQWGARVDSAPEGSVSFPLAFPASVYIVLGTSNFDNGSIATYSVTNTNFSYSQLDGLQNGNGPFSWFSIGK